jgi:hypothetical protein
MPCDVGVLTDNEPSESMVDRRCENSQSEGHVFNSHGRLLNLTAINANFRIFSNLL